MRASACRAGGCRALHPPPRGARGRRGRAPARARQASNSSSSTGNAASRASLNAGIARFYDDSSALWENMWDEHMHHGLYPGGRARRDHQQAQVDMIEQTLRFARVQQLTNGVDVGCGIGGSSRHMLRKFPGGRMEGVTLSPVQAARANERTQAEGLNGHFQVADALDMPFDDGVFDMVWSMESGEHMADKAQFVDELCRVCAPGGRIVIVTWCHRDLAPGEALREEERALLERISKAYFLPDWCSAADYVGLLKAHGLDDVRTEDWSQDVAPFWGAVIRTALSPRGLAGLLKAGVGTLRGALVMPLMSQGFKMGTIKFQAVTAQRPQ